MARTPRKTEDEIAATAAAEEVDHAKPRYRVIEKSFIGHTLHEAGAEITYEGKVVSDNLSPLNDAAQKVVDAQADAHLDKTGGDAPKHPRRRADAAAAGVDADDAESLA